MTASPPRALGPALIALSSFFFAATGVLTRGLVGAVPMAQVATVRHLVGLAAIAGYFALRRTLPVFAHPGLLLLRGLLGGAAVLTYFAAIEHLGAAPATVLNYTSPLYASLAGVLLLRERPSGGLWAGLVLAVLGAAAVTLSATQSASTPTSWLGAAAGVASGLFAGGAMAAVRAARRDTPAEVVFLSFSGVGVVLSAPFAAPGWVALEPTVLLGVLTVGAVSFVGQLLFTFGMGFTSATVGSATSLLVPVWTWLVSAALGQQSLSALGVAGALTCLGGVWLSVRR